VHLSFDADGRIATLAFDPAESHARFTVLETGPSLVLEAVRAGVGDGGPNQVVKVPGAPLQQASLHVFTLENDAWHSWEHRQDLDASGPSSPHFLLDPTGGVVTFGDAEHGRVPPDGALIFARYRATRAEAGNIGARKIQRLSDSRHNTAVLPGPPVEIAKKIETIVNPAPASGGAAAETLAHAIGRAIVLREAPLRAVTTQDFETLALSTPGVQLARAGVWANIYPGFDCVATPGIVTVILVPAMPVARPYPSAGLMRAVATHLNPLRTIGTRVEVTGPSYLEVSIQARVQAFSGASKTQVRQAVIDALNTFLDPLRGGPDQSGWPFGRDVYRSEILQTIDRTSGVDHVESLALFADGCGPLCGNICLRPVWLVTPGSHQIEVV
jgi:predicted phage baseplate assembly protein